MSSHDYKFAAVADGTLNMRWWGHAVHLSGVEAEYENWAAMVDWMCCVPFGCIWLLIGFIWGCCCCKIKNIFCCWCCCMTCWNKALPIWSHYTFSRRQLFDTCQKWNLVKMVAILIINRVVMSVFVMPSFWEMWILKVENPQFSWVTSVHNRFAQW